MAGDELWPEEAEAIADAVAMWTLGQWPNAFDAFPDKLAYARRNDQVVTLSEAMLGLSVGCATCHHHKVDPLSQRDDFGLEAVFAGSESFNRTYRQASQREAAAVARDPENILLAGFPHRRMEAEAVWDRLFREEPDSDERRLDRAWLLVFGRPIRADELASAREFFLGRPEKPTAEV